MTESELLAIIESEERNALGWGSGELNFERESALKYFNQEPYGNEQEGRSQIVTSEVSDTILWILPSLLKIFTSTDKAVEFDPERPEDEDASKQATDAVNYVFFRQNNGFLALHNFFFDALLSKNGYVKVFYEDKKTTKKEKYQGLTEVQLAMISQNPNVTIKAADSYPDPNQPPQGQPGMGQPGMPPQGPPGMQPGQMGQQGMPPMEPPPPAMLYDVEIEVTNDKGKVCITPVPPEEMLVHKDLSSVDLQDALFVAQRSRKTVSELKEMGYDIDESLVSSDEDGTLDTTPEYQARRNYDEEGMRESDKMDPARRWVWVTDAYTRVDFDGDGITELRRVLKAGKQILENEETEIIPFAALTPVIMSHRHFGKSIADLVMDLQLIKSALMRGVLDNVYLTNAPRMNVPSSPQGAPMANLDDLLTVRPGGVVRYWGNAPPTPLTIPFMAQHGLSVMEYVDSLKENRTGVTSYNQGLDANSLNKTATGITQIMTAAQQRIELIARIFAETGVKRTFQLILHCLVKYSMKPMTFRLRDKWVDFDPRNWSDWMDMTVNVGLGTGNKDQQLQHLAQIGLNQAEAVKMGGMGLLVTPKNLFNTQAKLVENAGFKNVEDFWTDPEERMPEPQPDPKADSEKQKYELEAQSKEHQMQLDQRKADQDFSHKERMAQFDMATKQQEFAFEQQKADWGMQVEQQKAEFDLANRGRDAEFSLDVRGREEEAKQVPKLEKVTDQLMQAITELAQAQQQMLQGINRVAQIASAPRKVIRDPKTGKVLRGEIDLPTVQ